MEELTLGDYTIIEISLAQFFKDLDISMSAGQQVQNLIGKIEVQIKKISVQAAVETKDPLVPDIKPELHA